MRSVLLLAALAAVGSTSRAADVRYPPTAGHVDVTRPPYLAKGDGIADDTAAIQKALDDHPNVGAIIYLPAGTYRITDTLRWPKGDRGGMEYKNTILEGESRERSVIRLADRCPGYGDPTRPKALAWTGSAPAQRFRNAVRNLTLDTGTGNPGAVGIEFMANNQGGMFGVTIRSGDGSGPVGLDLGYTDENGPLLLKDVKVIGFAVGVRCRTTVNSITAENLTLEGQTECGLYNEGQVLSVRKLVSTNTVPAVVNAKGPGVLTLVDAVLTGRSKASDTAAITNEATIFARNVKTPGYKTALVNPGGPAPPPGTTITEFVHPPPMALFDGPKRSLGLAVEETPTVPDDDPATWANVTTFGAGGNDYHQRDRNDDTPAFQKAIDSGATTVVVPRGFYVLHDTVRVRGKVRRILFMESQLVGGTGFKDKDKPAFRFEGGSAKVVVLERLNETFGSHAKVWIEHAAADRTLVLKNSILMGRYESTGGGRVFLEDVCGGPFVFRKQDVWARQLNQEAEGTHVVNDGGRLWVLGYKTERGGTLLETTNGGRTEVLGCFAYATTGVSPAPMFVAQDSAFSVTMGEAHYGGRFDILVRETRRGQTRELNRTDAPSRFGVGALLPLYVAAPMDGGK
jgi:hypothetical protein